MIVKILGVILMLIFGISGLGVTALAWLLPGLNLDKTEAAMAGLIGIVFIVFQSFWLKHSNHGGEEPASCEVQVKDNN